MTLDKANEILKATDDMTGVEIALATKINRLESIFSGVIGRGDKPLPVSESVVWFEVEYAWKGTVDYFTDGKTLDSIKNAKQNLEYARAEQGDKFDFRIVKKTLHTEVVG